MGCDDTLTMRRIEDDLIPTVRGTNLQRYRARRGRPLGTRQY
jgi:hypothetical protein